MGKTIFPFDEDRDVLVVGKEYVTYDLRVLRCTHVSPSGVASLKGIEYSQNRPLSCNKNDVIVGVLSDATPWPGLPGGSLGVVTYRPDLGEVEVIGNIYRTTDSDWLSHISAGDAGRFATCLCITGKVVFSLKGGTSMEEKSSALVIEVGRKYVNHIGEPVRILATDVAYTGYPVLGLYKRSNGDEGICRYTAEGCRSVDYPEQGLFEVPEKYDKDDLVQFVDEATRLLTKAYYSHYDICRAKHVLYSGGRTSKTTDHSTFLVKDAWPAK